MVAGSQKPGAKDTARHLAGCVFVTDALETRGSGLGLHYRTQHHANE